MKIEFKEKFLNFYYFFHYFIIIGNSFLLITIMVCAMSGFLFGSESSDFQDFAPKYTFFALFAVLIGFLYLLLTIISTIAIKKIKEHQNINFLEKFSAIMLPIITIPLYSFLIYDGIINFSNIVLILLLAFGFIFEIIQEILFNIISPLLPFINL